MNVNDVAPQRIRDVVDARAAITKKMEAMGGQDLERLYNYLHPETPIYYAGRGQFTPQSSAEGL